MTFITEMSWLIGILIGIILFYSLIDYLIERKEKEKKLENRIKFLEDKVKQKNEFSYGHRYKCGYCSLFGKATNCPRDEQSYDAEPCDLFKLQE